jgi:hypothetical protein
LAASAIVAVLLTTAFVTVAWAASQLVTLKPGDQLTATCETQILATVTANEATVVCATPAPIPTATSIPPTPTSVPPTATKVPPTATASSTVTTIGGIPVCTDHDPTKWHALVKRNADGSIACTYGHEHKDDPRVLDPVFGPLQYGEISYPWMTHSHAGSENDVKHRVYAWHAVQVPQCRPSFAPYGFDALRLQVHQDGVTGAAVRYHSYWLQARACDPNDPTYHGTITIGGHMDYGFLFVDCPGGSLTHVPLATDPSGTPDLGGSRRLHGGPSCTRYDATWYGTLTGGGALPIPVGVGLRSEDWGALDTSDPTRVLFYGSEQNGSWQEPAHLVHIHLGSWLDALDGVVDGYVTYSGYTDRHGNVVKGCTVAGTDCVPLRIERMKVGHHQFRADANGITLREYDVKGPTGKSLIAFPN